MYSIFRWTRPVVHRLLVDEVDRFLGAAHQVEMVLVAGHQVERVLVAAHQVELHLFQDRGGHLGLAHLRTLLELPTAVLTGMIV